MIKEANQNRNENVEKKLKPLIRLKVDYTDFDLINEARFAQKFVEKVANPRNILNFYR
jgi:double-strand break repair protein MRE11